MKRIVLLALIAAGLATGEARATRVEVHSNVRGALLSFHDRAYSVAGPAPFVTDLDPGRYRLQVSVGGRRLGHYTVDIDRGVHMRGGRLSRATSSAILPGSGQFRDDGWWSGFVTGGSVAVLGGRTVYLNVRAGALRDDSELAGAPLTDSLKRTGWDAWAHEQTRDDYLLLTGAFYLGNVFDGLVRRGPVRFRETASSVITTTYEPTGVVQAMLLSAVWPGLGQVRQGSVGRGRWWQFLWLSNAVFWAEARQNQHRAESDRKYFQDVTDRQDPTYAERLAALGSDVDERRAVARTAVFVAGALWAYNIVDAALVSRSSVADSGEMARNQEEESSWSLTPGWVGGQAGLVLELNF